jgi:hypothetical protein
MRAQCRYRFDNALEAGAVIHGDVDLFVAIIFVGFDTGQKTGDRHIGRNALAHITIAEINTDIDGNRNAFLAAAVCAVGTAQNHAEPAFHLVDIVADI